MFLNWVKVVKGHKEFRSTRCLLRHLVNLISLANSQQMHFTKVFPPYTFILEFTIRLCDSWWKYKVQSDLMQQMIKIVTSQIWFFTCVKLGQFKIQRANYSQSGHQRVFTLYKTQNFFLFLLFLSLIINELVGKVVVQSLVTCPIFFLHVFIFRRHRTKTRIYRAKIESKE